jgi:hypothetical protein
MKKQLFIILILIVSAKASYSQNNKVYLKENALPISRLDSLSSQIYEQINQYQLIMLGEIHGTNEPVNLLDGLASLLTKYGDSVQVGFEIPPNQMATFLKKHTAKSILASEFFSYPSGDGRASNAWYKTMANLNKNKQVEIFFFDNNIGQSGYSDSIMFVNIKAKMIAHPTWKTITICGSMHNRILPYEGQMKIGDYLILDKDLNIADKFCSLDLEFEGGETLWNEFKPMPSFYSSLAYDKYLFLFPKGTNEPYHGIFFTRNFTKSESAVVK